MTANSGTDELTFNSLHAFKAHYLPIATERERISKLPIPERWIAELELGEKIGATK